MGFFTIISVIPVCSDDTIIWDSIITITSATGERVNVTLGEALDANDGPPADDYDTPLPPQSPKKPFVLAWFTSTLPSPFQTLLKDYKHNRTHADTFKSWNLSIQWQAENPADSTELTLSWDTEDFSTADYTKIILCQEPGRIPLQNMLLNHEYTFTADALLVYEFSIICQYSIENDQPVVSNCYPPYASTGIDDSGSLAYRPPANLSITAEDSDGDLMNIQFRWCRHDYYHKNQWTTLTTFEGVGDGTFEYVPSGNEWIWGNTTYTWSVNVTDGISWTNETYWYTTGGSRYDVTNDGRVNFVDAGRVWAHRTTRTTYEGIYDVNDDGVVNFIDAGITWSKRDNLAQNAPPIAENDTYSLAQNAPLHITEQTAGVSANDVDFDMDAFNVTLLKATVHGDIALNPDGTFSYTPDQDFMGTDIFTYNASDGKNASNNATVTLNIGNPPVLSNIPDQTITQGGSFTSISLDDYVTDADNNDDELLWTISGNHNLIVTVNTTTRVVVISAPSKSWTVSETITFTVSDPIDLFAEDQATFKVTSSSGSGGGGPSSGGGYLPLDNQPPVADASAGEPYHGFVGEAISFDGSNSYDPDGDTLLFLWDFGDGTTNSTSNPLHTYTAVGAYKGSLTVSDGKGGEDLDTFTIDILAGNIPPTRPKVNGETHGKVGTVYTFTAVSTDADGDRLQYLFSWGDGTENVTSLVASGTSGFALHNWSAPGIYTLTVQARDNYSDGGTLSESTMMAIYIGVFPLDPFIDGYLIDENGDGLTYELFHNTTANSDTLVTRTQEGYYLIDDDGDAIIDYIVDVETNTITPYDSAHVPDTSEEPSYVPLVGGILLLLAALIIFLWVIKKPKK